MIKIGDWIVISDNGVWFSPFDGNYRYTTKKCAIEDIRYAKMDVRNKPKICRVTSGEYEYIPKSPDTGHDGNTYRIVRVNKENIAQYRLLLIEVQEDINQI